MKNKISLSVFDYKKALEVNICEIVFVKKEGSYRKLFCTLDSKFIPLTEQKYIDMMLDRDNKRKQHPKILHVYDLQNNKWRSFNIDMVVSFKILRRTRSK